MLSTHSGGSDDDAVAPTGKGSHCRGNPPTPSHRMWGAHRILTRGKAPVLPPSDDDGFLERRLEGLIVNFAKGLSELN